MDSNEGIITGSGMFYPKGFVVALVNEPDGTDTIRQHLRDANFDDVRVFNSQEILADVKLIEGRQSFFDRVKMSLSEEGTPREMYLEQIKNGASMVLVRAHSNETIASAQAILKAHGGQRMAYYGEGTIRELR